MKLNLGCGHDYRPGFVNIDSRPNIGADLVHDITAPLPYPSHSIDKILAQDVLEHFDTTQQQTLLTEIVRLLKPQGKFICRLPNIDDIISRFASDPETRNLFLYGDTSESGTWGVHKSGHTSISFATLALQAGLRLDKIRPETTNFIYEFSPRDSLPTVRRLVFINQTLGTGGAETFNSQLLNWFSTQGTTVSAYVAGVNFYPTAYPIPVVIDIIGNWKGLIKGLFLLPYAIIHYSLLVWKSRQADIILMTGFIEKILVTPIAKILKIPVIWVEFAPLETVFAKFSGLPKFLYLMVKSLPDRIIVPSRHTASHLIPQAHVSAAKVVIIPCARDISATSNQRSAFNSHQVVCVSRLESGKGQDLLIQAWAKVVRQVPDTKLRIVGSGAQHQHLKFQISNLKLSSSIELVGWVADSLLEISASQIVIFPSRWDLEGFGLVAIEAMALSKPVVCFNRGPINEIIDSSCGILVPDADIDALSSAIVKLLKNPQLARKLGVSAHKKYLANYTFSHIGPRYSQIIRQVIARHRAHELLAAAYSAV